MKWETVKLCELCSVITKGTTPSIIGASFTEHGIKYIRSEMLTSSKNVEGEFLHISQETHDKLKRSQLQAGDILFSMAGVYLGKTAILRQEDVPANTNQAVAIIRVDQSKCNNEYVYYFLNIPEVVKTANTVSSQSAQPNINLTQIGQLIIELPPVEAQERIVDILSSYDNLIDNNRKQIKLLEEAAQRIYKEWFVDLHFPGYENTPIIDGTPEGWRNGCLEEVANIIMGQSPKSEFYNMKKEGLPFHQGVSSYGDRFVVDDVYTTSFTKIAPAGSILFSVRAPVGRLNITRNKIVIGRGLAALNHKNGMQHFLLYMLKERFFKDNLVGNGSIFASISKDDCLKQRFLLPSDNLVQEFDRIVAAYDNKIEILSKGILLLNESRDRLLPKLMTGEMEV